MPKKENDYRPIDLPDWQTNRQLCYMERAQKNDNFLFSENKIPLKLNPGIIENNDFNYTTV